MEEKGYDPRHCQTSWGEEWVTLPRKAGIPHSRLHDLRHTYITRAAEAGVPLAVTQAQVGHMGVQMVEHLNDESILRWDRSVRLLQSRSRAEEEKEAVRLYVADGAPVA